MNFKIIELKRLGYISIILVLLLSSCKYDYSRVDTSKQEQLVKESIVNVNKYLVQKDLELIESYYTRRDWKMEKTKTGLYFQFINDVEGSFVQKDQIVSLNYSVDLLNGTHCYSSDSLGVKQFKVGSGGVEEGLEQAVLMMGIGDKARFIMPPHLGHGLLGDQNKIPPRSILVYEVEVLNIQ